MCGKNFSSRYNLKKHVRDIHLNKGAKFTCEQCQRHYSSLNSLQVHRSVTHPTGNRRRHNPLSSRRRTKTPEEITINDETPSSRPQVNDVTSPTPSSSAEKTSPVTTLAPPSVAIKTEFSPPNPPESPSMHQELPQSSQSDHYPVTFPPQAHIALPHVLSYPPQAHSSLPSHAHNTLGSTHNFPPHAHQPHSSTASSVPPQAHTPLSLHASPQESSSVSPQGHISPQMTQQQTIIDSKSYDALSMRSNQLLGTALPHHHFPQHLTTQFGIPSHHPSFTTTSIHPSSSYANSNLMNIQSGFAHIKSEDNNCH